jgi:hypothetical protein
MRQEIIDYIEGLSLGSFILSPELPWSESGTSLYIKNIKRLYVSNTEYSTESIITTLNGLHIDNQTTSVRIFFSTDAKQLPADYDELVGQLIAAKNITTVLGVNSRICNVSTEINNDLLTTELEIRFTKLLN